MKKITTLYRACIIALVLLVFLIPTNTFAQCGTTIAAYPYAESFETPGVGAWVQDTTDDINWTVATGGPFSGGTGTNGASAGSYYIYTEASVSGVGFPNKRAFLNSPCFDLTGLSSPAFSFDYHMYGSYMGVLKIQVSTDTGTTWTDIGWSQTGQSHSGSSAPWLTAIVDLSAYAGTTIKLRFHGTTGTNYTSDMAVDNLNLSDYVATCPSTVTLPYSEDFETGFGQWLQDPSDNFDWTRQSGGTPTANTGPSAAGSNTFYLFTEASGNNNSTANLESPCFNLTTATLPLLSFAYHMYGADIGTLNVQVSTNNGLTYPTTVWSQTGQVQSSSTQAWNTASVNLSAYVGQTIRLRFNGITGGNYASDMGIDLVTLTEAPFTQEINVQGLGTDIADGDPTPNTIDDTDFGTTFVGSPVTHTFTIQNFGASNLTIGAIAFTGANAGEFSVVSSPSAVIPGLGSTTFDVNFNPIGGGLRTATISIVNNDPSENPYNFALQGTATSGPPQYTAYYETFDSTNGGWSTVTSTNDTWTWANSFPATELSEGGFWRNSNYNNYNDNTTIVVQSPVYNFSGLQNLQLSLDVKYKTENNTDGMRVLYSVSGGAYALLGASGSGTEWYDDNTSALGSDGWNNNSHPTATGFTHNKFKRASLPLSDATFSNQSNVRFRIEFRTNGSTTDDGVAFDNLWIEADPMSSLNNPTNAPADITNNLRLWLRGDQGISMSDGSALTLWEDYAYDTTLDKEDAFADASLAPIYHDNANDNINFNPVVKFDHTNTEYMNGKGGFFSQDYFAVVFSDDVVDTQTGPLSPGREFVIGGRYGDKNFHEDPTGLGFGSVSARYSNEVISHTINSFNNSGAPSPNQYGRAYTSSSNTFNHVMIVNVKSNPARTQTEIYKNGKQIDNTTGRSGNGADLLFTEINNVPFLIGTGRSGLAGRTSSQLNGRLSEIISYRSPNSAINQQKIQSYLGIKYGVTLQSSSSGLTNYRVNDVDYIDSNGNIMWDTSVNNGYNYDVAGIGRDDKSFLNQKQSKSVNEASDGIGLLTGILTMGLTDIYNTNGNNIASNPTTLADGEFLVWGNNGSDITLAPFTVNVDMSSGIGGLSTPVTFDGMRRIWKVVESGGDVPSVKVSIPQNAVRNISPPGSFLMFISNTNVFDPTADYRVLSPDGSGNLEADYDFVGTKYITFGYAPQVIVERSVYFDGLNDYIEVGDYKDLNAAEFTISAWINRSVGSNNRSILSKRDGLYTVGYDLKVNALGQIEMSWLNGSKQIITGTTIIPENEWHQVSVIFNSGTTSLYIDGLIDQATSLSSPIANNESFIIAGGGKITPSDLFIGNIDEVRLWDVALSVGELRFIMNQEIEDNASFVGGMELPTTITKNEVASIPWTNLTGYYPMSIYTYTNTNDHSDYQNQGALRNLNTVDFQTAPLPYESDANGNWDNNSTWLNGTINRIPGSPSIVNSNITIDWNIVETSHNIDMDNTSLPAANLENRTVLGLSVNSNELSVISDSGLSITHYLKVDGLIDLEGESQLIQNYRSDLDATSSGSLERDQQGTSDTYTYNYWSSPVATVNTTANNQDYTIPNMLRDGTNPAAPGTINFLTSSYNGTNTAPIGLADYWLWKFANGPDDDYSFWQHVRSTGTMQVGQGYTMKGPGTGTIATPQNYVYTGKPNNADISVNITAGHDYLVGNPYPSAIDAHEFLNDNPLTGGTLYFWEHWGGGSHNLGSYQGGYAMYNYSGGTGAGSFGTNDPDVGTGGSPTKLPGQFIPVAQGFFVVANTTGTVNFENDQRVFVKEGGSSVFVRAADNDTAQNPDTRMKFRIGLNSINEIHRQLLLTVDNNASSNVDWGYDGKIHEEQMDDMYWMIEGNKYVIQGTNLVDYQTIAPVGIHTQDDGINTITIDRLENVPDDVHVFVFDKELSIHHDLRQSDYQVFLTAGEYLNRFEIVFNDTPPALDIDENELADAFQVHYANKDESIVIINPDNVPVESLELFNILGQSIKTIDEIPTQLNTQIKISNLSTGTYIVKLNTEDGTLSKQVLVK